MADHVVYLLIADFGQDFGEGCGGSAGRIFLGAMMHLNDFQIKTGPQNFGGFAREPKEGINTRRVIGSPDDGDMRFGLHDARFFGIVVAGGPDDERFLVADAKISDAVSGFVKTEVDGDVGTAEDAGEVVALVHLADDLERRVAGGASE